MSPKYKLTVAGIVCAALPQSIVQTLVVLDTIIVRWSSSACMARQILPPNGGTMKLKNHLIVFRIFPAFSIGLEKLIAPLKLQHMRDVVEKTTSGNYGTLITVSSNYNSNTDLQTNWGFYYEFYRLWGVRMDPQNCPAFAASHH